jgi:Terminase small subunit
MPALSNPRRERFSLEYCSGEGPTSAYTIAFGNDNKNPRLAGMRLLAQPDIKARVAELMEQFAARALVKAQQIQMALLPALEANLMDFVGDDGKLKPLCQLKRDHGAAIKSLRCDKHGRVNEVTLLDRVAVAGVLLRSIGAIRDSDTNLQVNVLQGLGIGADDEAALERELRAAIEADRAREAAAPVQLDLLAEAP